MTTFTWAILSMSVMPVLEGESDVVVSAQWNLNGSTTVTEVVTHIDMETEEPVETIVDKNYTSNLIGWQNFTLQQDADFIPYNQLTQEQVIEWVKNAMSESGVASMEVAVQGELDALINPPTVAVVSPLPW